jgi:hypothetical protein
MEELEESVHKRQELCVYLDLGYQGYLQDSFTFPS